MDYRAALRANILRLKGSETWAAIAKRARYVGGPRAGKLIGERTLRAMAGEAFVNPTLDAIAGVAQAFGLDAPHKLLIPGIRTADEMLTLSKNELEERAYSLAEKALREAILGGVADEPDRTSPAIRSGAHEPDRGEVAEPRTVIVHRYTAPPRKRTRAKHRRVEQEPGGSSRDP